MASSWGPGSSGRVCARREPNQGRGRDMLSPIDEPIHRSQLPLFNENAYKLGIFCLNVSYGTAMTRAPGTLTPTWDQTVRIAQAADRAGWEFLLPLGRWRGTGGNGINMNDRS